MCLPDTSDGEESACNSGDQGLTPGLGRSPGEGNGYTLQCSCLEFRLFGGLPRGKVKVSVTQSRLTLSDPMGHSPPNFSVRGVLLAGILEWVAVLGASGDRPACQCRRHSRCRSDPWVRKSPWRRAWPPALAFLPEEPHGQRSLVDDSHRAAQSQA